jgi:hypothetical protein
VCSERQIVWWIWATWRLVGAIVHQTLHIAQSFHVNPVLVG